MQLEIDLEPEIWSQLCKWSEDECRTVSGQITYLVKRHAPPQHHTPSDNLSPPPSEKPTIVEDPKSRSLARIKKPQRYRFSQDDDGWEFVRLSAKHLNSNTQKMSILELVIEYNDSLTNEDLLVLAEAKYPKWVTLNIGLVIKQTSNLFYAGLLKRKRERLPFVKGRTSFQYIVHPRAMRLVKRARLIQSSSLTSNTLPFSDGSR